MNAIAEREPAHGLFRFGLVMICALAAADLLGLPGGASVGMLMMLAGMPFWANAVMARRSSMFDPGSKAAIAVVLTAAAAISVLCIFSATYAYAPLRVARGVLSMTAALAMASFVAGTLTQNRLYPLLTTVVASIGAVSALSIAGYLFAPLGDLIFNGTDRAHGTFKNPNQYGIVISTVAPVAAALIVSTRGKLRLLSVLSLLAILVGLLLSGSKANLMLTGAGLSMFALLMVAASSRGMERVMLLMLTLVAIAVAGVVAFLVLSAVNPRAVMLLGVFFDADKSVPSLLSRQSIWEKSFEIFRDNPWSGEGAGQLMLPTITHSHNLFIEYARALGAPGLITVVVMIGTIVVMLLGTVIGIMLRELDQPGLRALVIGLAISCQNYIMANMSSESFGPSTSPFFWLLLFVFFAVRAETLKLRAVRSESPPRPKVFRRGPAEV